MEESTVDTANEAAASEQQTPDHPFVYAIGRVEPHVPSVGTQKELDQAIAQAGTAGLTDREAMQTVLSSPENRYLARELCFTLSIESIPTYLLVPRDRADINWFVDAIRPRPHANDLDVVVGNRGPLAPPAVCNGINLPVAIVDQIYSFDRQSLIDSIPAPESGSGEQEEQFRFSASELFERIMQVADNSGNRDEHRAMNYLSVRYPAIYSAIFDAHSRNAALTSISAQQSRLSGARNIIDVIFSFTNRNTDVVEKQFVRVDVAEKFPFLASKLAPYYERP